jgi:endonuclease III
MATDDSAPVERILDRLREEHGPPAPPRRLPPLDELVLTILSQNTSDVNSERAYAAMRSRYPTWDDVRAAPEADLVDVLRPGGLANVKAPRIQAVLRALDGVDLAPIRDLEPEEALRRLVAIDGVGPKTAACVLLFSLGVPVMPVDTHVHRVATRLGLLPPGMAAGPAHAVLTAAVPPARMLEAHLLLIAHGRRTCSARRPACGRCSLLDLCPAGSGYLATAAGASDGVQV